jgi:hypothetical protein
MTDEAVVKPWRGGAVLPVSRETKLIRARELHGSPLLQMVVRRDKHSSGVAVWVMLPTGGEFPSVNLVMAERWNDPLPGEEGTIEIAIAALQTALGKIRGLQEGQAE